MSIFGMMCTNESSELSQFKQWQSQTNIRLHLVSSSSHFTLINPFWKYQQNYQIRQASKPQSRVHWAGDQVIALLCPFSVASLWHPSHSTLTVSYDSYIIPLPHSTLFQAALSLAIHTPTYTLWEKKKCWCQSELCIYNLFCSIKPRTDWPIRCQKLKLYCLQSKARLSQSNQSEITHSN